GVVLAKAESGTDWRVLPGARLKGLHFSEVSWSPDGKAVAAVSLQDVTLRFWDVATATLVQTREGIRPDYGGSLVAWSPDGRNLAVRTGGRVQVWEATSGKLPDTVNWAPTSLAWSPDGRMLAGGDGWSVRIWDNTQKKIRPELDGKSAGFDVHL